MVRKVLLFGFDLLKVISNAFNDAILARDDPALLAIISLRLVMSSATSSSLVLPRSRARETATRAVGNDGNLFCVSCDAIDSSSFCVDCDAVNGSFCVNCNAVGGASTSDV